jgi:beta-glucosidase
LVEAFLDPLAGKGYPSYFFDFSREQHAYYEKDLRLISHPIDFLGVNHCFRSYASFSPGLNVFDNDFTVPTGLPVSDLGGPVMPDAFYDLLIHLGKNYSYKSLYITKNGLPMRDSHRSPGEAIDDDLRIHYLGSYLAQAKRALDEGVPLRGYYVWSLMDHFEWCHGYDPRHGLIHVDFETSKRTFKKSAAWYQCTIGQNGFDLDQLPREPAYRLASPGSRSPAAR